MTYGNYAGPVILEVSGIDFDAGHSIPWHLKCSRLHGHTYNVRVAIEGYPNPETQMVLDFGVLKQHVKAVADEFDHRFIANSKEVMDYGSFLDISQTGHWFRLQATEVVLLQGDSTVENICAEFAIRLAQRITGLADVYRLLVYVSEGNAKGAQVSLPLLTGEEVKGKTDVQLALPGMQET
jgi:6-pyruvoyltetrahydropterin/6-carboxytetrahydropterin synthase